MPLSAAERETSIVLNDEEDTAHVYTAQPAMMRRLARHPQAVLVVRHKDEGGRVTGEEWDLPKALVSIRAGKRPVSQAQRDAARRNMARMRAIRVAQVGVLEPSAVGATMPTLPSKPRQNLRVS